MCLVVITSAISVLVRLLLKDVVRVKWNVKLHTQAVNTYSIVPIYWELSKAKQSKVDIAVCNRRLLHRYVKSHAIWDHTVSLATRQR